jgi:YD repeat-containing protein
MRIKIFSSFEEYSRQYNWHLWYAWHPILIDGTIVWMEKVYRKRLATTTRRWCYKIDEYDSNGNLIHSKDSDGFETWHEYDANGNLIHYKSSGGVESWYDSFGKKIDKLQSTGVKYHNDQH